MPETEQPPRQDQITRSRRALPVVAAVFTGAVLFVLWNIWTQMGELEERLEVSQNQSKSLELELEGVRREAGEVRAEADQAESRALSAEEQARQLTQARQQAELERELAREQARRSEAVSRQARREAEIARQEADEIRQQREQELDRMQKAFSHIVDTRRTPLGMVMNLGEDSFLFDFDNDTLRPENREILSRIAGVLLASHGYRLYVYGHTDDTGPASYNRTLSDRRARSVRSYLVRAGVPQEVVEAKGFGESSPAVKASTSQDRQKNRRVEIGLIDTVIHYEGQAKD